MSWFKYLKSTENISSTSVNTNYSYPYCKRIIDTFTPRDTLSQDSWLFVNIKDLNINRYKDSLIEDQIDQTSYLVVYEYNNVFTPVKTVIDGDYLYFTTVEQHAAAVEPLGRYNLYYSTPNIRKVNKVNNGGTNDYQINLATNSQYSSLQPYYAYYTQVDVGQYSVGLDSNSSYNFSFINSISDWNNGQTSKPGSKVYISFTGPKFYLYGSKGPKHCKFKIKFTALQDSNNNDTSVFLDWQTVDCYSTNDQENVLLFSKEDFEERDYSVEIEVLYDKNILSTGNIIKFSSFSFSYNLHLKLGKEIVNLTDNSFTKIIGVR